MDLGHEIAHNVIMLHDDILRCPNGRRRDYGSVTSEVMDRDLRLKVHQDIRRIFSSRLETVTTEDGRIEILYMSGNPVYHQGAPTDNRGNNRNQGSQRGGRGRGNANHGGNDGQRKRGQWADLGGDYLHFSLAKENKDTMEVISWLSRELRNKPSAFQFAGTKDRRAVTVQRVSVYRIADHRMRAAGRSLRGAKIGDYEYRKHPLALGDLSGNAFTITLRNCDFGLDQSSPKSMIDNATGILSKAVDSISQFGFINYYGLQRFGTFSTSTDHVGIKILQGNFESAVNAILEYSPDILAAGQDKDEQNNNKISREDRARAVAIRTFQSSGNPVQPLKELPRKFSAEGAIIRHLGKVGKRNDFLGALQTIPRNLRMMYTHAYQSLIWNMAASQRWKLYKDSVVEGDLVLVKEHQDKNTVSQDVDRADEDGEAILYATQDPQPLNKEDPFTRARVLSAEEAQSGQYTIYDVVLPTPGFDILYPANEIGEFYKEFMASERGGGLDPHDMHRNAKDINLSGSYRKVIARPLKKIEFELRTYDENNEDQQFVETDLDRLNAQKVDSIKSNQHKSTEAMQIDSTGAGPQDKSTTTPESPMDATEAVDLIPDPQPKTKLATILHMQLATSQYATMALREMMKAGGCREWKPDYGGGR